MEYIKTLRASSSNASGTGTGTGTGIGTKTGLSISSDPDGFPIVPNPASWDKVTKDELERLYRSYIGQHYSTFLSL
jgi:hypothetical protein